MIYLVWCHKSFHLPCLSVSIQLHQEDILLFSFVSLYFIHWPHLCNFFHLLIYWHSNSVGKWTAITTNAITTVCLVIERSDHPRCDPHILLPTLLGTEDIKAGLLKEFLIELVFHMKFCTDNSWIRNICLQREAYSKHSVFHAHCLE